MHLHGEGQNPWRELQAKGHTNKFVNTNRIKECRNVPKDASSRKALRGGHLHLQGPSQGSAKTRAASNGSVPEPSLGLIPISDVGFVEAHDQSVEHSSESNGTLSSSALGHQADQDDQQLHGHNPLLDQIDQG